MKTVSNVSYLSLFERSEFLVATSKKKKLCVSACACVRLILVLVGGRQTAIVVVCTSYVPHTYVPGISGLPRYVYDTRYVLCTRYVCTWYQPATQIRMYRYLVSAGRRTFRPWTHTSDDSYIYQLSLVVATATVPGIFYMYHGNHIVRWHCTGQPQPTSTALLTSPINDAKNVVGMAEATTYCMHHDETAAKNKTRPIFFLDQPLAGAPRHVHT